MITIEEMVQREVVCCMSSLVSTLAGGYGSYEHSTLARSRRGGGEGAAALGELVEQAFELSAPVADYEEAAIQAGWKGPQKDPFGATFFACKMSTPEGVSSMTWACADWQTLCNDHDIDPYDREVFEHWAVSPWLSEKLQALGEKVDPDFGNMHVWARCTTGQAISADGVIERIYADMIAAR